MSSFNWAAHFFQIGCAAGFLTAIFILLSRVLKTEISDKYGIFGGLLLSGMLWCDLSYNWFSFVSVEFGALAALACFGFVAVGITFSTQLTAYSKERRAAIQNVALWRYRYEELQKKTETSIAEETALPH